MNPRAAMMQRAAEYKSAPGRSVLSEDGGGRQQDG